MRVAAKPNSKTMKPKTKAFVLNFICFAVLYILVYFLIGQFTQLTGWMKPVASAIAASILAPKFQAIRTNEGEVVFMQWMFLKGVHRMK